MNQAGPALSARLACFMLASVLCACGGPGLNRTTTSATPTPTPAPAATPTATSAQASNDAGTAGTTATITDPRLGEISGIVAATSHQGFWVHNDSGDDANIYALNRQGQLLAIIHLAGVSAVDWEDLTAFSVGGQRYLLIADIGDNQAKRDQVSVLIIPEPVIHQAPGDSTERTTPPTITITAEHVQRCVFRYPNGPRDAESVAVDPLTQHMLVLSKRTVPPELFTLPIPTLTEHANQDQIHTVQHLAIWPIPPMPLALRARKGIHAPVAHQPTAMSISADGLMLAVSNYTQVLVYQRRADQSWGEAVQQTPRILDAPVLRQTEALCWLDEHIIITSEQLPAPLISLPIATQQPAGSER